MNAKRLTALLLILLTLFAASCARKNTAAPVQTPPSASSPAETHDVPYILAPIRGIDANGSILLDLTAAQCADAGFVFCDLVTARIGTKALDLPLVHGDSDVPQGRACCLVPDEPSGFVSLAVNGGSFAEDKRIAVRETTAEEPGYKWTFAGGGCDSVALTLSQREGFLSDWLKAGLVRSTVRGDYPDLSDEEYANFRAVITTGMGENKLYRSSTPLSPGLNRNKEADAAARAAGVRSVVNFTDAPADLPLYPGYSDTYYSGLNTAAVKVETDFFSDRYKAGVAEAVRFIGASEPPFLVHCHEGKDRTGFFCAVLEALTGASADEIVADYMKTYENFYGVQKDSEKYFLLARVNIRADLAKAFELDSIDNADLAASARKYLLGLGLSSEEIDAAVAKLS